MRKTAENPNGQEQHVAGFQERWTRRAAAALSAPQEGCLYFAGEATDVIGDPGTVQGALATGARAAAEILGSVTR